MNKMTAVITGVAGQDGSYLAEYLIEKGYKVIGISRRKSVEPGIINLEDLFRNENFIFLEGDITDATFISRVLHEYHPHEYYNLAAMSIHPKMKLPLKRSGHGVRYSAIDHLWKEYSKNNKIEIETINTEGGPIDCEVININYKKDSNATKALGYKSGMGVWKPIKQISRHFYKGSLIRLKQKWGEVIVTPNHSLYNSFGELVRPTINPELFPVRKINCLSRTYKNKISLSFNIKNKLERNGDWVNIIGKNNEVKVDLSNDDDSLNAFLRFCGAYISEGWLYQKNRKRYSVFICQNDRKWLEDLQKDLSFFYKGKSWISKDKNGCHILEISSKIMYFIMKKYCGILSENKHMPNFIFDLNIKNKNNLLKTLLEGDGSFDHNLYWSNERITQTSEELALQLSLLFTENNWDYTIDIKEFKDKNWKKQYTIRRTRIYQFGSGNKIYEEIPYEGWVYDISVDEVNNFTCGFGNILVHNSHVGQSFKEPASTFRVDAEAVVTQLELIRQISPYTRFYQASTSELFGGLNCPQEGFNESSPFHPRSPYAVAKMAAYWAVVNYREAYGIYACNGILFNHSCISKDTALTIKRNNFIEIINPEDLLDLSILEVGKDLSKDNIQIWDGESWVKLKAITVKPTDNSEDMKGIYTNTRSGIISTTNNHNLLNENKEKQRADSFKIGDKLLHGNFPKLIESLNVFTKEEAELLGLIVGDGWVHKQKLICHIGNNSDDIVKRVEELWSSIAQQGVSVGKFYNKKDSFGKSRNIKLNNFSEWHFSSFCRDMIYDRSNKKRIPFEILNSSKEIKRAFLDGYNLADGLKKNNCTYKYKNFKTNSQILALGLIQLIQEVTQQKYNLNIEQKNNCFYYSINLLSDKNSSSDKKDLVLDLLNEGLSQREIHRRTGISRTFIRRVVNNENIKEHHYRFLNRKEIKKQLDVEYDVVYDIETETGKFMAGAGNIVIANSPRRGIDFATRKITRGAARTRYGLQKNISMGNLSAFRDEGHSKDYIRAMHLMLQQQEAEEFVIATGQGATIEDMFRHVADKAGFKFEELYEMNPKFMRPSDVAFLLGDASKAKEKLGWEPEYTWKTLLDEMYEHDIKLCKEELGQI